MSADAAADLMAELLNKQGELRQDDAAMQLQLRFGDEPIYYNEAGNLAIKPEVLKAFRKLTPDVVWFRSSLYWRKRQPGDQPGRVQPY
jgi:hypothetical protein